MHLKKIVGLCGIVVQFYKLYYLTSSMINLSKVYGFDKIILPGPILEGQIQVGTDSKLESV